MTRSHPAGTYAGTYITDISWNDTIPHCDMTRLWITVYTASRMESGSHQEFGEASNLVVGPLVLFAVPLVFDQTTYSDQPVGCRGERVKFIQSAQGLNNPFFSPALAKAKLGCSHHCHKSVCLSVCMCVCPAVHEVLFLRNYSTKSFQN